MNTHLKTLAVAAVVAFGSMGFAVADQWDKLTTITIDEPMQLPSTTLQPGTYVIKLLATSSADRHTVQFFDKDQKHIIATIEAIPNERVRPTGKSVFAFWETPAGQPKALRAWFYPGDNFGQEFAYPKDEAARISASNNNAAVPIDKDKDNNNKTAAVRSSQNDTAAASPAPAAEPAPAPAPVHAAQAAPVAEPAPAPAPVEVAAAQRPARAAADNSSDAQRVNTAPAANTLPRTASSLPLFALIGLLSMGAALALRFAYNRS